MKGKLVAAKDSEGAQFPENLGTQNPVVAPPLLDSGLAQGGRSAKATGHPVLARYIPKQGTKGPAGSENEVLGLVASSTRL